jgi:hypothetical protein
MSGKQKGPTLAVLLNKVIECCLHIGIGQVEGLLFIVEVRSQKNRIMCLTVAWSIYPASGVESRGLIPDRPFIDLTIQLRVAHILVPFELRFGLIGKKGGVHIEHIRQSMHPYRLMASRSLVSIIDPMGQGAPIVLVVVIGLGRRWTFCKTARNEVMLRTQGVRENQDCEKNKGNE